MKILYLSYDGLTDALGQSQILAYQRKISSPETSVTILSFEKSTAYKKLGSQTQEACKEAGINWIPLSYTKKPPVLSTLYDLFRGWVEIKRLQEESPFDLVHCRGYISALLGEKMHEKYGTKFIFDMRGWWPDEKLESGAWKSTLLQPVYRYFKKKEIDFFSRSTFTVSLTEVGKQEVMRHGWQKETSIGVVPTCTDLSLFQPSGGAETSRLKKQLGFPEHAVILVYSGALGGNYPLKEIFLCLQTFVEMDPSHHCLILSKDTLSNLPLPNRTVLTSVNYAEVGKYLSLCKIGLIYYTPAFSNIGRCPTKLGEYWACGVKAISPSQIGDLDEIFEKYPGSGACVASWDKETIQRTLVKMLAEPHDNPALRKAALDFFSLEKGVDFYRSLYRALL